jgi:hypothetical protein
MKSIGKNLNGLAIIGGLIASLNFVHAQTATVGSFNGNITPVQSAPGDSVVSAVAEDQGLPLLSPDQALSHSGSFCYWWVMPGGAYVPMPCLPQDFSSVSVYQIIPDEFLVDESGGQVPVIPRRLGLQAQTTSSTVASAVTLQADALVNLITRVQTAAANQQMRAMGMDVPFPGDGGSDTNSYDYSGSFQPQVFTTNDLWLQITGTTNTGPSITAWLVINTPWTVTNGVYDLFATTNLAPSAWQWVLRCAPGQTNLTVTGLTDPQNFFILGLTNDADGDGLTDAYELLVSHTDPNNKYSNLDGIPDGWEILLGLNPQTSNLTTPSERSNYGYTLADWLNGVSGIKSGTAGLDNEGNVLSVSQ